MNCAQVRAELSARIDGEGPPASARVDRHLQGCAACRHWLDRAYEVTRRVRMSTADAQVDVVAAALAARRGGMSRSRRAPLLCLRMALALVGGVSLVVAALPVVLHGPAVHVAHEVSAWDVAYAVALLVAAARPRRVAGLVPLATALVAVTVLLAAWDVAAGRVEVTAEGSHVFAVVSLGLLWMLDRRIRREGPPPTGSLATGPTPGGTGSGVPGPVGHPAQQQRGARASTAA